MSTTRASNGASSASDLATAEVGEARQALRQLAEEQLLEHLEEQGRGDEHAEEGDAGHDRVHREGPDEDLELGHEAGQAGQTEAGEGRQGQWPR